MVTGLLVLLLLVGVYSGSSDNGTGEADTTVATTVVSPFTVPPTPTTALVPPNAGPAPVFTVEISETPPLLGAETGLTVAFRDGRGVQVLDLDTGERQLFTDTRLGNGSGNLFTLIDEHLVALDFNGEITAYPLDGGEPEPLLDGLGVVRDEIEQRFWVLGPEGEVDRVAVVELSEITWLINVLGPYAPETEFFRSGDEGIMARNQFGTYQARALGVEQIAPSTVIASNGQAVLYQECATDLSRCGWVAEGPATGLEPQWIAAELVPNDLGSGLASLSPDGTWLTVGWPGPEGTGGTVEFTNLLTGQWFDVPSGSARLASLRWAPDSSWALWREGSLIRAVQPTSQESLAIDVQMPTDDRSLIVVSR